MTTAGEIDREETELLDEVAPIEQFLEDEAAFAKAGEAPKSAPTTDRKE